MTSAIKGINRMECYNRAGPGGTCHCGRVIREGLSEEVTLKLRPEASHGVRGWGEEVGRNSPIHSSKFKSTVFITSALPVVLTSKFY